MCNGLLKFAIQWRYWTSVTSVCNILLYDVLSVSELPQVKVPDFIMIAIIPK